MKVQLFSDLHIEFEEFEANCSQADVVIFAGDIDIGIKGIAWIKRQKIDCPIIYVLGNHEYYRHSYPKLIQKIMEASIGSNVHILENRAITIDDVCFHGATLWTDYALFGDPKFAGYKCQELKNDFKLIRRDPSYSKLRTIDVAQIHNASLGWLAQSLEQSRSSINVIVTHHAPSQESIPDYFKDHIVAAAYASHLDDFILKYQPDFWLHGHVHVSQDYSIGRCRVLCNPRGYSEGYRNQNFNSNLLIDVCKL